MKLPSLKSCLFLSESIMIDDKEKNIVQKVAWTQIKKNKKNSLEDVRALRALAAEMKLKGPYDLEKLRTDPKLRSHTGMALDEMMTDWILEDGLRQEMAKYTSPEDKVVLQGIEEKWTGVSEDKLPGGKGDKASPKGFDPKQIKKGLKVEREHTDDPETALEIVLDHLTEDPKYYDKLEKVDPHGDEG